MINTFMQFIYCFLFLLYSAFVPASSGWAVTLIWAMMILPLADVLMNCLQNLTSRIAGLDNNEVTMRGVGLGATFGTGIGYSINAIKTQFTNHNTNTDAGNSTFFGRVKNFINPQMNLSAEKDYNGNINPIRNVVDTKNISNTNINTNTNTMSNRQIVSNIPDNTNNSSSKIKKFASGTYKATKTYLQLGANMAEGNFNQTNHNRNNIKDSSTIVAERNINQKLASEKESDANEEI